MKSLSILLVRACFLVHGFCVALLALGGASCARAQLVAFDTVALEGDILPGDDDSIAFRSFGFPVLNDVGQVAFTAHLDGANVDSANSNSLFLSSGGLIRMVASEAKHVFSGLPNNRLRSLYGVPNLNDAGNIAIMGGVTDGASSSGSSAVIVGSDGSLVQLPRVGIGTNDELIEIEAELGQGRRVPAALVFNGNNRIVFEGYPANNSESADRGIAHFDRDKPPRFYVKGGDVLSVDSEPVTIREIRTSRDSVVLNDRGQTAFSFWGIGWPEIPSEPRTGLVVASEGKLEVVMSSGERAPDAGQGARFSGYLSPALNTFGHLAYKAFIEGNQVDHSNDIAIYSEGSSSLALVAREGDSPPGLDSEVKFLTFEDPLISDSERVTFLALLDSDGDGQSNSRGLFTDIHGRLETVAIQGDFIPGSKEATFFSFDEISMNSVGQIAFQSFTSGRNRGIFVTDRSGILRTVVREGEWFDVNPDPMHVDRRIISEIRFGQGLYGVTGGGGDGRARNLSDSGQLVFGLGFEDGTSGVFMATIGVPEPGTSTLLVCVCVMASGIRATSRQ